jgi:hypothetical protein
MNILLAQFFGLLGNCAILEYNYEDKYWMLVSSLLVIIFIFSCVFRHSNHNNLWSAMADSYSCTTGSNIPLASRSVSTDFSGTKTIIQCHTFSCI